MRVFKDESAMIRQFFLDTEEDDIDYLGAWNLSFGIQTLVNRYKKLNGMANASDAKFARHIKINDLPPRHFFYKDQDRSKALQKKNDYFIMNTTYQVFDQLLLYGSSTFNERRSYRLDYIAEYELGMKKTKFEGSFADAPYIDFGQFGYYNIIDSILLYLLEKKLGHLDLAHMIMLMQQTRFEKAYTKSVTLKNHLDIFALGEGEIINNVSYKDHMIDFDLEMKFGFNEGRISYNVDYQVKKARGGIVAEPMLNSTKHSSVPGSRFIFKNGMGMDYSSLYPSLILTFNLSADTLAGKLFIENEDVRERLEFLYDYDTVDLHDLGNIYMENLTTRDWIGIGARFYGLPTVDEMLDDIQLVMKSR